MTLDQNDMIFIPGFDEEFTKFELYTKACKQNNNNVNALIAIANALNDQEYLTIGDTTQNPKELLLKAISIDSDKALAYQSLSDLIGEDETVNRRC